MEERYSNTNRMAQEAEERLRLRTGARGRAGQKVGEAPDPADSGHKIATREGDGRPRLVCSYTRQGG